ncbi:MAG: hypothetical protein RL277_159, partial [Planctomycetota bacterium]
MKSPMEALVEELVLACRNGQEG